MEKYYLVSAENGMESDLLKTKEEAEKWAYECLPIGIQKCRTGTYEILEVNEDKEEVKECEICGELKLYNETCEMCNDWKMD